MKKLGLIAMVIFMAVGLVAQTTTPTPTPTPATPQAPAPVITFEKTLHDFGKFNEQDGTVTYSFKFTNTGNAPLVINRVHASCGCTTPNWTREPILPGRSGTITASFNPAGRPGAFLKTISVFTNVGPNASTLSIKGDVTPRPAVSRD